MKAIFGYQYFDTNQDEIIKDDIHVDYEKAIELFNAFPWDKQLKEILRRNTFNQTSTQPTLYFLETDKKFLSISASDDKGYHIKYINENKHGSTFLSNNVLLNNTSIEDFIEGFFNNKIEDYLELFEFKVKKQNVIQFKLKYNKSRLYLPLLTSIIPFIYVLIKEYENLIEILPFAFLFSLIFLPFSLPYLFLNFSYWKNDKNQSLTYDPNSKILSITQKDKDYQILKNEIKSVEIIQTNKHDSLFSSYKYLRFKANDKTFIITHLFKEPEILISTLNLNYKEIKVFYPMLKFNIETVKQKQKKQKKHEQKRIELIQTYSEWNTEKLEEIIKQPYHYEDYAVAAATEILKRRQ